MIIFLDAVVLSQLYLAYNVFYQHIVTFIGVLSIAVSFVFAMFILFIPICLLSSDCSCSIKIMLKLLWCPVHKNNILMPILCRQHREDC